MNFPNATFANRYAQKTNLIQFRGQTNKPKVFISCDYDGTASKVIPGITKVLNDYPDVASFHLNTGRTLQSAQKDFKFPGLIIHFLSLMNGSFNFKNDKKETADQWVPGLSVKKQMAGWQDQPHIAAWDRDSAASIVHSTLDEEFSKTEDITEKDGEPFSINRKWTKEPEYRLESSKAGLATYGQKLVDLILGKMKQRGLKTTFQMEDKKTAKGLESSICYSFVPEGCDKGKSIDYTLENDPDLDEIQKVITAGDGINDLSMLERDSFQGKPNIALVCGDNPKVRERLQGLKHVIFVKNLPDALKQLLEESSKPATKAS